MRYLLLPLILLLPCLVLVACAGHPRPKPHDTAALERNLAGAQTGLSAADASAERAQGHVTAARGHHKSVDDKAVILEEWLERMRKQQEAKRRNAK